MLTHLQRPLTWRYRTEPLGCLPDPAEREGTGERRRPRVAAAVLLAAALFTVAMVALN